MTTRVSPLLTRDRCILQRHVRSWAGGPGLVAARIPHGSHLSACLRLDAAASADSICDPAWGSSTIAPMSWVSLRSDGPVVHDAHVLARGSRTRIHPRGSPPGAFFCRVSMDSSLAHGRSESLKQSGSSSPYDASSGRARPVRPKHCDGSACRPHRMLMSLNRARWAARPHVSKRRHPHSRADLKSPTISCRSSIGPPFRRAWPAPDAATVDHCRAGESALGRICFTSELAGPPIRTASASVCLVGRKLAVVGLVLLILLLVIPLGIGMVMGACPTCTATAPNALSLCVALLVSLALAFPMLTVRIAPWSRPIPILLLSGLLDRPPRSV